MRLERVENHPPVFPDDLPDGRIDLMELSLMQSTVLKQKKRGFFARLSYDQGTVFRDFFVPKSATRFDPVLLAIILVLVTAGSLMIFSASYAYAEYRYGDSYYFIGRQIIWVILSIALMLFCSTLSITFYKHLAFPLYIVVLILLIAVLVIGQIGNGAQRWISLGPLTIQPSEIAKTSLVLILARYFSVFEKQALEISNKKRMLLWGTLIPFAFIGLICLLVMLQKHLSGIIILGSIGICVMFASGISLRYLGYCCGAAGVGVTCLALFTDYTKKRITTWLNPELYPLEGGWQTLQGLMAIGSGGFFGLGFGQSRLKYSYVSEPANDMIFTILCEELGFLGAAIVIGLFLLFIWRSVKIALTNPDTFARLTAIGITAKISIQVLLNIAVVTNTIPNTGISLPFFSYGGSSMMMILFEMGILLSISRTSVLRK
jgi:cell division protein FtsW